MVSVSILVNLSRNSGRDGVVVNEFRESQWSLERLNWFWCSRMECRSPILSRTSIRLGNDLDGLVKDFPQLDRFVYVFFLLDASPRAFCIKRIPFVESRK